MIGEISYDLKMEDDMDFIEGCYRVENGPWQVVIVSKRPVEKPSVVPSSWESGVVGVVINVPLSTKLSRWVVEELLSEKLGVDSWKDVRGPDSIELR